MLILIIALLVLTAASTFVLFYTMMYFKKRARILEKVPVTPIADLDEEGLAKVVGKVAVLDKTVQSPMTKIKCVYYHFTVERQIDREEESSKTTRRRRVSGDEDEDAGDWEPIVEDTKSIPFAVEDETGTASIDGKNLDLDVKSRRRIDSGYLKTLTAAQEKRLEECYPGKKFSYTKKMRYREIVVEPGDELMVTGEVLLPKGDNPRFASQDDAPIHVSDQTVNEAAAASRASAKNHLIFSSIASACTLGVAVWLVVHLASPKKSSDSSSSSSNNTQANNTKPDGNLVQNGPNQVVNRPPEEDPFNEPRVNPGIQNPPRKNPRFNPPNDPPRFDPPRFDPPPMKDPDEGLPKGNDMDSILARFKAKTERKDLQAAKGELNNLRLLFKPELPKRSVVFNAVAPYAKHTDHFFRGDCLRTALAWSTKDETLAICKMVTEEKDHFYRQDMFNKLKEFKDPRCAEPLAIYLKDDSRRDVEAILRLLDSSTEKVIIPYTKEGYDRDTRASAINVLEAVGAMEGVKTIEEMTRDADDHVNRTARTAFETASKRVRVDRNLSAILAAVDASFRAKDGGKFNLYINDLKSAYRDDHPKKAETFALLIASVKAGDPNGFGRRELVAETIRWSTKDDVAALCELLKSSNGESAVFVRLKELKDPKSADVVASFLTNFFKAREAADVLRDIGPAAQKAVHPYTLEKDPGGMNIHFAQRQVAVDLLGDIGTKESIPILQQLSKDRLPFVNGKAQEALRKVQARAKAAPGS